MLQYGGALVRPDCCATIKYNDEGKVKGEWPKKSHGRGYLKRDIESIISPHHECSTMECDDT